MYKKLLITGGAGFIGANVIRHIINNTNHSVINVDKLTYASNIESLESIEKDVRYIFEKVDICDGNEIERVLNKYRPDILMHLAAESHVDRSIDSPSEFIQTNIVGTYILLEQARTYWSGLKGDKKDNFRFHHVSTDEVYGDLKDSDDLFTENTAYAPSSPYSAAKASSDHLVRAWQRTFGLPTLITNCSNNYGPYQFPEKLVPLIINSALEGKELPIYGDGKQTRDWLYVNDHAKALLCVSLKGEIGETYNIGGHSEIQNIELVKKVCSILDELIPSKHNDIKKYEQLITYVADRAGHDERYATDASKIVNELGWIADETFETGIRKTVQWYLDNKAWCARVQDKKYQDKRLRISIIGFGYIGAVIGGVFSNLGHKVTAVDSNVSCINELNLGQCSVPEPALKELIRKGVSDGNLAGSTEYESVPDCDVVLVTVGTPLSENFDADLTAIRDVFRKLSKNIKKGQIIMLKSTVPPGVTRQMTDEFFKGIDDIYVGFSPERLAEGDAIEELRTLPIVVGGINELSTEKCADFWKLTLGVEVIKVSSCETAELVKLANNQWIDLNIALANELAILSDAMPYSLDVLEIIKGANSLKKGQHHVNILQPSIGVGGYCLTKDPWFLSTLGSKHGLNIRLPSVGRKVNDIMPSYAANEINNFFQMQNKDYSSLKVAILGYSFKSNSGDVRFSPMENFVEILFKSGYENISVFDSAISESSISNPKVNKSLSWEECVKSCDCVVFGAAHDDIKKITMSNLANCMSYNGLVYDGRRYLSKDEVNELQNFGITYKGVGRSFS